MAASHLVIVHDTFRLTVNLQAAGTTKKGCDVLQTAFEDKGVNRRCMLLEKLFGIKLKHHTPMDNYVTQVLSTAQEMASIGKALDDDLIAALLLQGLSNDYKPMKMAMENSGIELTTAYVKTMLLQEQYLPTNGDNRGIDESAYVSQYRSRFDESGKRYAKSRKCKKEDHRILPDILLGP
jgi:hypothetical protein